MRTSEYLWALALSLATGLGVALGLMMRHFRALYWDEKAARRHAEAALAKTMYPEARVQKALPDVEAALTAPPAPGPVDQAALLSSVADGLIDMAQSEGRTLSRNDARAEALRLLSL